MNWSSLRSIRLTFASSRSTLASSRSMPRFELVHPRVDRASSRVVRFFVESLRGEPGVLTLFKERGVHLIETFVELVHFLLRC